MRMATHKVQKTRQTAKRSSKGTWGVRKTRGIERGIDTYGGESELRVTWKDIGTHKSKCVLTGACS